MAPILIIWHQNWLLQLFPSVLVTVSGERGCSVCPWDSLVRKWRTVTRPKMEKEKQNPKQKPTTYPADYCLLFYKQNKHTLCTWNSLGSDCWGSSSAGKDLEGSEGQQARHESAVSWQEEREVSPLFLFWSWQIDGSGWLDLLGTYEATPEILHCFEALSERDIGKLEVAEQRSHRLVGAGGLAMKRESDGDGFLSERQLFGDVAAAPQYLWQVFEKTEPGTS